MSTTLTVLGSCGAWPEPGRACSGYLVEHEDFRIVLDLGYGTLSRLLELLHAGNADGLDAVAVTHRHPDHMVDLHGLMRARWFGARRAEPLQLLGPQGVVDSLVELEEGSREAVDAVFTHTPLPSPPLQLGPFEVHSQGLPHFVPNAGIRLSVEGGPSLAYTGDTGPSPALAELARDVDLLVAEASSRSQRADTPRSPQGPSFHLTAREAGQAAVDAGARRLLLTHFWPGNNRERSRAEAAEVFDGEILLAGEGMRVELA